MDAQSAPDSTGRDEPPAEAVVAVDIDADVDAVWNAITTEEGLADWLGEGSTIGAAPGDELRFRDRVSGEDKRGYLDEFTPLRRLGYTWWPETDPDRSTRVAISLEPCPTGTRVTVVESRPNAARLTADAALGPCATTAPGGDRPASACVGSTTASLRADWLWRLTALTFSMTALSMGTVATRLHG